MLSQPFEREQEFRFCYFAAVIHGDAAIDKGTGDAAGVEDAEDFIAGVVVDFAIEDCVELGAGEGAEGDADAGGG